MDHLREDREEKKPRRLRPKREPQKKLTHREKLEWAFKRMGLASPWKDDSDQPK